MLCLLPACTPAATELPVISLTPTGYTTALGEDRFVTAVMSIVREENVLCMNDTGSEQLICVDDGDSLHVVQTIGRKGKGPGEFGRWPSQFDMQNGKLYVFGPRHLKVFTSSDVFERNIPMPFWITGGWPWITAGNLFVSNTTGEGVEHPLVKLDSTGSVVKGFGTLHKSPQAREPDMFRNERYLEIVDQDYLVAVGAGFPVVEKYTLDGDLIAAKDFSQSSFFAPGMEMIYQRYAETSKQWMYLILYVISAIEVYGSILYMLISQGTDPDADHRVNTILALDLASLELLGALELTSHERPSAEGFEAFQHTSRGELLAYSYTDGVFYRYDDPFQAP